MTRCSNCGAEVTVPEESKPKAVASTETDATVEESPAPPMPTEPPPGYVPPVQERMSDAEALEALAATADPANVAQLETKSRTPCPRCKRTLVLEANQAVIECPGCGGRFRPKLGQGLPIPGKR